MQGLKTGPWVILIKDPEAAFAVDAGSSAAFFRYADFMAQTNSSGIGFRKNLDTGISPEFSRILSGDAAASMIVSLQQQKIDVVPLQLVCCRESSHPGTNDDNLHKPINALTGS